MGKQATESGLDTPHGTRVVLLFLCLAESVRRNSHLLFDQSACQDLLENLDLKYPRIADYIQELLSRSEITGVARALLSEGVSISNFRKFCECLADAASNIDRVAAVRLGMGPEIIHQAARGTTILSAYLLEKSIVDLLLTDRFLTEEEKDRILGLIHDEIVQLPRTVQIPAILAPSFIHPKMRELIRYKLPRVLVLAHDEVTPDVSIQPVARIGLG